MPESLKPVTRFDPSVVQYGDYRRELTEEEREESQTFAVMDAVSKLRDRKEAK